VSCPDCGGDGTKYVSMCQRHQAETLDRDARLMGVADLMVSINDPTLLAQVKEKLASSCSNYCLVKVIP